MNWTIKIDINGVVDSSISMANREYAAWTAFGIIAGTISYDNVKKWRDGKTRYSVASPSGMEFYSVNLVMEDITSLLHQQAVIRYTNRDGETVYIYIT